MFHQWYILYTWFIYPIHIISLPIPFAKSQKLFLLLIKTILTKKVGYKF